MTKKKLNNLLNFIIFVLPLALLLGSVFVKISDNGVDTWAFDTYVNSFINGISRVPLFGNIAEIIGLCFGMSTNALTNCPFAMLLCGFIVYLVMATFCIIIKDLLLLLINICNKYIFLDDQKGVFL